ncbi:hypothetical protein ANN_06114 [Periplaneta americana]|uniref:Uncharacterized protein n=1 Tax=Periplaneta americana TaxID=6978 RepID=A0ABQ8TEI0_PERAM|nr:hypothetical protein ANN_06114 [Periplaneta americana]
MAGLCEGGNEPPGSLKATSEWDEGDNAGEMSPGSSTESYPAFAYIGSRENPGKNLNQVTCPDRESNPGHLVSQPDALTVTPQLNFVSLGSVHLLSSIYQVVLHVAVLAHCLPASFLKKSLHRALGLPAVLFPVLGSHMVVTYAHLDVFILLTWPPHFHFSH